MAESLLDVGLSSYVGAGNEADVGEAARSLVAHALADCRYRELPIRLAMLLATEDWSHPEQELPRHVRAALRETLHRDVSLIGGCMAKVLVSTHPEGFLDHGIALALFCSFDLWASVACLEKPYLIPTDEERRNKLKEVAQTLEESMSPRLGSTADRYLLAVFPGFTTEADGRHMRDSDFHWEVKAAFAHGYHLYGASSTDTLDPKTGYQFVNDKCYESSLAVALVENDLKIGAAMRHPFEGQRGLRVSIDRLCGDEDIGADIEMLDGKPAPERLKELKEEKDIALVNGTPVFGLHSGGDFRMILPLEPVVVRPGCVRVNRNVALGDRLIRMRLKDMDMVDFCEKTADEAFAATDAAPEDAIFFLGFACRSLYSHFSHDAGPIHGAVARFRQKYPRAKAMVGLCAAEFAATDQRGPNANHMCLWTRCYVGQLSHRASGRIPIRSLSLAANDVLSCTGSADTMQKALEGAVSAGAFGGQICLWDRRLNRILGEGFGRAYQPHGSPHDWLAVSTMTNRDAPVSLGGNYPADIEDWLIRVVGDLNLIPSASNGRGEEDILTLVARTGLAILVPDAREARFHCREDAVEIGGFKVLIAVPIIGAKGNVLGTFQASFEDGKRMNREEFDAWIQYVTRVGVLLEAAIQREERDEILYLHERSEALLGTSFRGDRGAFFQAFCDEVRRLLGADAVHMRLLKSDNAEDRFELVGYAGPPRLKEIYPQVRPITSGGRDGACGRRALEAGGVVSSSRVEAEALRWKVTAIENRERWESVLKEELDQFSATATLPVKYGNMLMGSLIIDSTFEFFFSERIERLARECADVAAQLIRAWEGDRLRQAAHEVSGGSLDLILHGENAGSVSDESREKHRLRSLVESTCRFFQADWASLYVWYEECKELVLLMAHGWDRPLEGEARYRVGEGFTGHVAESNMPILLLSESHGVSRRKYDEFIEPPEHRSLPGDCLPRVGVKLTEGSELVGVLTFGYHRVHADRREVVDHDATQLLLDVAQVVSGWVTSLSIDRERIRRRALDKLKDELASGLLIASSEEDWQRLLDCVRQTFEVEHLALYLVENKTVRLGWMSPRASEIDSRNFSADEFPALARMIAEKHDVLVRMSGNPLLEEWPNLLGINTLYAVAVLDAERNVRGVLEFVNRAERPDHPFRFLDSLEREGATDIAGLLGAALASRDHNVAIERLRTELAAAMRIGAASLFGAIAMHDLMGPFTRIQRAVDKIRLFRESVPEPWLLQIESELKQSTKSIERLKQQAGLAPSNQEVRRIVREALQAVDATIPKPGVKLVVSNDLHASVRVSMYSIAAAVVNILSNALEAMGETGVLTVRTMLSEQGMVLIQVHDTGPSLTLEQIDRILRSPATTKGQEEHLGLGVHLARQAVEAAGGTLTMESRSEGGVLVTFALPMVESAIPHATTAK